MVDGWDLVAAQRRAFADLIDSLDDAQLDAATLSGSWTPRHIAGHVASFVEIGLGRFFLNMAKHRFDYDSAADTLARRQAERPVAELTAALRDNAAKKSPVPVFPPEMTLTDVAVHTQDIRRPLGLDGSLPDDVVRTALEFVTTHKMAKNLTGRDLPDGVALEATDLDWGHGSGDAVIGTGEAILLALCGRPVVDELSGPGVSRLS